jgi:hypothetical protein
LSTWQAAVRGRHRDASAMSGQHVIVSPPSAVVVYRRPGSDLDERIRAIADGIHVSFADARYSAAFLDELTRRVVADMEYWNARDITIYSVGPAADASGVDVGTETLTRTGPPWLTAMAPRSR